MSNNIHQKNNHVNDSGVQIIFMGTPEFSVPILEKLIDSGYRPVAVFCAPDKPVGRKQTMTPPPVKVITQKYDIPVYQPKNKIELADQLKTTNYQLIITAAYGLIFPKEILDVPKYGCLNIHPSLLPKYRGSSPIQAAILNGDAATGVTIYKMDEQIDHGAIIAQEIISINNALNPASRGLPPLKLRGGERELLQKNNKLTTPELSQLLSNVGAELLLKTLPDWLTGKITSAAQDDTQATYTKIITKKDGQIDWQKSAAEIERQIRAFVPWPGSYATLPDYSPSDLSRAKPREIKGPKIKILQADILPPYAKGGRGVKLAPGLIFLTDDNNIAIQTDNGALIIKNLQLEGGKPLNASDFLLGHKNIIGKILI